MNKVEELLKKWRLEYDKLTALAEEHRNEPNGRNYDKYTYKALQLKYCIKQLKEHSHETPT